MTTSRLAWIAAVLLAIPGMSLAQQPDCQPDACGPRTAQFCMPVDGGPKDCCWNRLLQRLCIRDKQYVLVSGNVQSRDCGWNTHGKACPLGASCLKCNPAPACARQPACSTPVCQKPVCQQPVCAIPAPVCQTAAPSCGDPHCPKCCLLRLKPLCRPAAPSCGNPNCTKCGHGYAPAQTPDFPSALPTPLPEISMAAPKAGTEPTLYHLESLLNAQAADSRAFQQTLEKKLATLSALRAMQDADMQSLTQLEGTLRQARLKQLPDRDATPATQAPARQAGPTQMPLSAAKISATDPGTTPEQMIQQMEQLNREIVELNRVVKQLSNKN